MSEPFDASVLLSPSLLSALLPIVMQVVAQIKSAIENRNATHEQIAEALEAARVAMEASLSELPVTLAAHDAAVDATLVK